MVWWWSNGRNVSPVSANNNKVLCLTETYHFIIFFQFCNTTGFPLQKFLDVSFSSIQTSKEYSKEYYILGWNKSCIDVQGRLCTPHCVVHNRPWTSIQDLFHPISWQTPVAAVTVYSAPDDGRKGRPKHVEHTCSC